MIERLTSDMDGMPKCWKNAEKTEQMRFHLSGSPWMSALYMALSNYVESTIISGTIIGSWLKNFIFPSSFLYLICVFWFFLRFYWHCFSWCSVHSFTFIKSFAHYFLIYTDTIHIWVRLQFRTESLLIFIFESNYSRYTWLFGSWTNHICRIIFPFHFER